MSHTRPVEVEKGTQLWECDDGHLFNVKVGGKTACPFCEVLEKAYEDLHKEKQFMESQVESEVADLRADVNNTSAARMSELKAVAREVNSRFDALDSQVAKLFGLSKVGRPSDYIELSFDNILEAAAFATERGFVMIEIVRKEGPEVDGGQVFIARRRPA